MQIMMRLRDLSLLETTRSGWAAAIALGAAVYLSSVSALVLSQGEVRAPERDAPSDILDVSLRPPPTRAMLVEYDARPLFTPGRKPPAATARPQAAPLSIKVVGLSVSSNGAVAVLRKPNGEQLKVGVDETVDGWKIVEISAAGVKFESNGRQRDIAITAPGD